MKPNPKLIAVTRRRREEILLDGQTEFDFVQERVLSALDARPSEYLLVANLREQWRHHALALPSGWFEFFVRGARSFVAQNPWVCSEASGQPCKTGELRNLLPLSRLLVRLRAQQNGTTLEVTP